MYEGSEAPSSLSLNPRTSSFLPEAWRTATIREPDEKGNHEVLTREALGHPMYRATCAPKGRISVDLFGFLSSPAGAAFVVRRMPPLSTAVPCKSF